MVLEVTALVGAAKATTDLVKVAIETVDEIRSGFRADNEAAKKKLAEQLAALKQSLHESGRLARFAERYVRTHEEILVLLDHVQRAQQLVGDNVDDFRDQSSARFESSWRVLETLFSSIDDSLRPVREAVFDRMDWFVPLDKGQIEPALSEFEGAYREARQSVRLKAGNDIRSGLDQMARPLQVAETLVRNTLFREILPGLQSLGPSDEAQGS
jgi:hypothetical protein